MEAKDIRFKILINNSETQLIKKILLKLILPWIQIQIQIGPKSWIRIQIQCIWIHNTGFMQISPPWSQMPSIFVRPWCTGNTPSHLALTDLTGAGPLTVLLVMCGQVLHIGAPKQNMPLIYKLFITSAHRRRIYTKEKGHCCLRDLLESHTFS